MQRFAPETIALLGKLVLAITQARIDGVFDLYHDSMRKKSLDFVYHKFARVCFFLGFCDPILQFALVPRLFLGRN